MSKNSLEEMKKDASWDQTQSEWFVDDQGDKTPGKIYIKKRGFLFFT